MKILKNSLKAIALVAVISFGSCEEDFSTVGSDMIGGDDFHTEPYNKAEITAYSKKITAVQTNGLPQYLLGAYNDPVYGLSQASILTQLSLSSTDPDFGTDPVLDSVVLVLPYYSTVVEETQEEKTYKLDSIYGAGPIKVSVYESKYFLGNLDPESDFEENQLYYSNQQAEFENHLGTLLFDEQITASKSAVVLYQEGADENGEAQTDTLRLSPRLRMHLPTNFFQSKIIDKEGSQALLSNANFQSYFRGLYLKAEAVNGGGHMAAFNLLSTDAKVVLYYTHTVDGEDGATESSDTFVLNFSGNNVNVYDNNFQVDLTTQDTVQGESNLYLKGGEGAMVVVELFSGPDSDDDGVSDELEMLREKKWLINEANLTFVVNDAMVPAGKNEPERIFIYDLKNNEPLLDYQNDFTASENNPLSSRLIHLGRLREDEDGNRYYKIRITGHIRNIINQDSTNLKLGLVVSSNVNLVDFVKLKDAKEETVSEIPAAAVISPEGTVLYGNTASDESKRLKLNIFYTETK